MKNTENPSIDLFISTQCPHCAQMLETLTKAVKQGTVSQLNIINLSTVANPQNYSNIRSVPFIKIGDFEFSGNIKQSELDEWLKAWQDNRFANHYLATQLEEGNINHIERFLTDNPKFWFTLVELAQDEDTKLQVRIGISSIFETLSSELLKTQYCNKLITSLINATNTPNHSIRVDLVYILSLIFQALKETQQTNKELSNFINQTQTDKSDEIKEIIEDVLN